MAAALQPAFINGSSRRLFLSCFTPRGGSDRWLLFVPPFAEEMNKSRRMMARLGHALAERGIGMCLPDLYGTGDSEGDFGDARVPTWQQDLVDTAAWLQRENGATRVHLGGLRYGALLLMGVLERLPKPDALLLWQPVAKGQQQITQYLRLRQAAAVMGGGAQESLKELLARLDQGEALETAGYLLAPELVAAIRAQELAELAPPIDVPVHWLELSRDPAHSLSPVGRQVVEAWQARGCRIHSQAIEGEPFWTTQELVDAPRLVDASVAVLTECLPQ